MITLRHPDSRDASRVWRLVRACTSLDDNSLYCNLLQCEHFAQTCVVGERAPGGEIVGWVSAYIPPDEPGALFVWQVAVHPDARGMGLAKRMLRSLIARDACADVRQLRATITADNGASWALFSSLAREYARDGKLERQAHYRADDHFEGRHATEHLVTLDFGRGLKIAA
jgi:L-2,4-diaminobutyric acid acetyltransferase